MTEQKRDLILMILDMQGIEDRLREFERRYRLRSSEFYRLIKSGKIEQRLEFIEWLGLYEVLLDREAEYRERLELQTEPLLSALNDMPAPA